MTVMLVCMSVCECVCLLSYVSLCADDMPMINLWPHLYATAREIDGRERIMLSEHDLGSVSCVCACI